MDMDDNSTQLFDDFMVGHDDAESFIGGGGGGVGGGGGYDDPLFRMAFTDAVLIQYGASAGGYRRLDSPSLLLAKGGCAVAGGTTGAAQDENNLSNESSYDEGMMTLPLLDDFRLDEDDITASRLGGGGGGGSPDRHSGCRGGGGGGGRIGKRITSERGGKPGKCRVCGDLATGMYFGALVCVPCKTFFLRYEGDNFNFVCKGNKDCEITMATRTQCKFCRYQKCREAGMVRRVRPAHVNLNEGQQLCVVCHDVANGIHFGAVTCEGCKKFFRRGLSEHAQYSCKNGQMCVINPRTRNSCRFCRYKTCLGVGMSREAIQMGRPSKLTMESSSRMQRGAGGGGLRTGNGNGSGVMRDDRHRPSLETALQGPAYLVGTHRAKEEPPVWGEWPMDQTIVGHTPHLDAGNFGGGGGGGGGQMTSSVPDFLVDSPAEYGSPHPVANGLLSTPFSVAGQTLSHMGSGSVSLGPSSSVHYGNVRWTELNADASAVAKQGSTVRPVMLNALYHNSGGSVHQMNNISPYEPLTSSGGGPQGPVLNHAVSTTYHDSKANIPVVVNGGGVSPTLIQFSTDAAAACMHRSVKLGHLDPLRHQQQQQLKLEHFSPSQSLKIDPNGLKSGGVGGEGGGGGGGGQMQNFSDVLESFLLDGSCQSQEQAGISNKQERVLGHDLGSNYVVMTTAGQQQQQHHVTGTNNSPETNGDCAFANARPAAVDGSNVTQSEKLNNQTASCVVPSSRAFAHQQQQLSQQRSDAYLNFEGAVVSSEAAAEKQRCAASSPLLNPSPISTGSARDDAVVPMLRMSAETKTSMESIAEWVFQLQQSYVDGSAAEDTPTAPALGEDLAEVCRGLYVDGVPFERQIERSTEYWKKQELPDENIMVGAEHWRLFNHFHPLYANYVSMGGSWNHSIRLKFEQWKNSKQDATVDETMAWVKENVFPAYTELSHGYFTQIQGFKSFSVNDQRVLLRLAQSQSRVLAAALAWFNPDSQTFTDFLPWREALDPGQVDLFKELLTDYAKNIQGRNLDPVESALFNIVVVIATDYPGLLRPDIIESYRTQFLATFRAYTTAKYGTPNRRMEKLFQLVPQLRRLGHLHYAMTQTPNIAIKTISSSPPSSSK